MTQRIRTSPSLAQFLKRAANAGRQGRDALVDPVSTSAGRDCILVIAAIAVATMLGDGAAIAIGLALFAAGLPHGFIRGAQANPRLTSALYWFAYVSAAAVVLAGFLIAPIALLMTFLAFSLVHFSISDALRSKAANLAIAALAVGGSALFQPTATAAMLGLAAGEYVPAMMLNALAIFGGVGVLVACVLACLEPRQHWTMLLAIAIVALLQPVLAVGAIFYLYHAAPIQRRSALDRTSDVHFTILLIAIALCFGVWLAGFYFGPSSDLQIKVVAAGAIAIVFPHLIEDLLDRAAIKSGAD